MEVFYQIVKELYELLQKLTDKKDPVFLTWLPLSHSYEHTVQFIQIIVGAKFAMLKV